ncbi:MAG: NIPSNAP family protein [Bacteroidales bacterium]|nr:NIPSNAP family protein [Bacteroidales bacterium]
MMKKVGFAGILFAASIIFSGCSTSSPTSEASAKEIYEWRIYTLKGDSLCGNDTVLDAYLSETFIPAYNRLGVTIGAFTPYVKEPAASRYLLLVYPSLAAYHKAKTDVWKDQTFRNAAQPYFDTTAATPLYSNFESFLCEAFDVMPQMRRPDKERTLFEYRIYHSPNEEANQRKIKMFNNGEINIFDRTGVNSVCYGAILAGSRMPALIYLTWYRDDTTRNEAWGKFRTDEEWVKMRALPEYANATDETKSILLSPLPYSQF